MTQQSDVEGFDLGTARPAPRMFTQQQIGEGGDEQFAALLAALDIQARQPAVRRLRDWSFGALAPKPGERALDVGSGTGSEVRRLAEAVAPDGSAVGIEPNHRMRAEAERRAASARSSATFLDGSALALPLAGGSIDVARCERVFQHLYAPQAAGHEIARVLAPGGRVALLDSDWGTMITHPGDPTLVRRYQESNWSRMPNAFSGRHLANQLREAGLEADPDIGSQALIFPPQVVRASRLLETNAAAAVADGHLTQEEMDSLTGEILAAADGGWSFMAVTMFAVIARKTA